MEQQKRHHYDKAFKERVLAYCTETSTSLSAAAAHFGITRGMLSKWQKSHAADTGAKTDTATDYQTQIRKLQREISAVRNELSVLKTVMSKAFLQRHSVEEMVENLVDKDDLFSFKFPGGQS
jgi:transposase-like protein